MCGRLFVLLYKNRDSVKTAERDEPRVSIGSNSANASKSVMDDRYSVHVPNNTRYTDSALVV